MALMLKGRQINLSFEVLKNKGSKTGWFGILFDGTKLPPVRIKDAFNSVKYLSPSLKFEDF